MFFSQWHMWEKFTDFAGYDVFVRWIYQKMNKPKQHKNFPCLVKEKGKKEKKLKIVTILLRAILKNQMQLFYKNLSNVTKLPGYWKIAFEFYITLYNAMHLYQNYFSMLYLTKQG